MGEVGDATLEVRSSCGGSEIRREDRPLGTPGLGNDSQRIRATWGRTAGCRGKLSKSDSRGSMPNGEWDRLRKLEGRAGISGGGRCLPDLCGLLVLDGPGSGE
jgi:hypothetical protein